MKPEIDMQITKTVTGFYSLKINKEQIGWYETIDEAVKAFEEWFALKLAGE